MKRVIIIASTLIILLLGVAIYATTKTPKAGAVIGDLNGVNVYYNGMNILNSHGRNLTGSGYNLGQRYQCVEFVKRYYYVVYNHEMPDSYGHAYSFYIKGVKDGELNRQRALLQYSNPSSSKPKVGDLIVFDGKYGHVGIVAEVEDDHLIMVQQNKMPPKVKINISNQGDQWRLEKRNVVGWLRYGGKSGAESSFSQSNEAVSNEADSNEAVSNEADSNEAISNEADSDEASEAKFSGASSTGHGIKLNNSTDTEVNK